MKLCAISFKECWQEADGRWFSDGGFPIQMSGVTSLFDTTDLLIVRCPRRTGGSPLPANARVIPMQRPHGFRFRRKISVILRMPYYLSMVARHVRQADAVHTPLPGDIPLLGFYVALAARKPLLVRYCNSWMRTSKTTVMNVVTRNSMRLFAGGRNVMLATGHGRQQPGRGISWIFSTALTERELAETRPDLDRGLQQPARLIYAGRLSPEKGVAQLLQAMALLKQKNRLPMPRLTIAGDGPERQPLERLAAKLDLQSDVRFAGLLNRPALFARFAQSDVCVQPSFTEGFSKAWLDAMALGVPVLSSAVGASGVVIGQPGERGWLVPPGDVAQLANAIHSVLTDPIDWPALRGRCRAYCESRTLEAWVAQIGRHCEEAWQCSLVSGKLVPATI